MPCKKCNKDLDITIKGGFSKKSDTILLKGKWGKIISLIFLSLIFLIPFLLNVVAIVILWRAAYIGKNRVGKDKGNKKNIINEKNKNSNNTKRSK